MQAPDRAAIVHKSVVTGIILAGGQGRRMGGCNKGLLNYNARPLVSYAVEQLRPQVDRLMIIANQAQDQYRVWTETVYADDPSMGMAPGAGGPLLGIWTALQHTNTPWAAVMPCDSLGSSQPWVADMLKTATLANKPVAFLDTPAQQEYLHCVIRTDLMSELQQALKQGRMSVQALWRQVAAVPFPWPENLLNLNFSRQLSVLNDKIATNVK
jgi:molybdopterin-guanine dinucleotide biosynthesis protein A